MTAFRHDTEQHPTRPLRRARYVLGCWVVVLAVAVPLALHQTDHLTAEGFTLPGSDSRAVWHDLESGRFPSVEPSQLAAVLSPAKRTTPAEMQAAVARVRRAAAKTDDVRLTTDADRLAVAAAGHPRTTVVPLQVAVGEDRATRVALDLRKVLHVGGGPRGGVTTYLVGPAAFAAAFQGLSKGDVIAAETVSLPLLALILVAVFGSLTAAALPLALGVATVASAGALVYALSHALTMYVFVTNVASMVGLGVAVDYTLFVLARYRQEVAAGGAPAKARATAMRTSGVAVAFSGLAVAVSLAGVMIIDSNAIRSVAAGAMIVVAVAVLAAATLLPALIEVLGPRLHATRAARRRARPAGKGFWQRWTAAVTARPLLFGLAAATCLVALAVPALSLQVGTGALRELGRDNEARIGFDRAAQVVGVGNLAPVHTELSFRTGTLAAPSNQAATDRTVRSIAADPEVAQVTGVVPARDGRGALISAAPRSDGESERVKALVRRLRSTLPADSATGVRIGGIAAGEIDFEELITDSIWKVALLVSVLAIAILIPVLRSLLLPIKAALLTVLSLAAAYGVLVIVFQWGWLDGLLGYHSPGYVNALALPLVLALVVGLSMDYEVFLMLRIRERFVATGDTRRAIAEGLALSARSVSSAALIMVAVFAAFVGTGVTTIKEIGLGNAVAIGLDATLVRLVLVPATMLALGRWNWWLPRPLERLLRTGPCRRRDLD